MIYVLRSSNGLKIGYSKNPATRLPNLRTGDPTLELLLTFPGDRKTEKAIQRALSSDRRDGEFFNDSPGVINKLIQYSKYYKESFQETP